MLSTFVTVDPSYLHSHFNHRIAVYDLGGGTFDISILEIQQGVFEVSIDVTMCCSIIPW